MAVRNVIQAALLLAEFCFSLAAVVFLSRSLPGQAGTKDGTTPSSDCNMKAGTGSCPSSNPESLEMAIKLSLRVAETNFALAILSLVIAIVRTASLLYSHVPRYTNILYDVLLSGLWCFSVTQQFVSTELAGCHPGMDGLIGNLHICHVDNICVFTATVGMLLYGVRILVDYGIINEKAVVDRNGSWNSQGYSDEDQDAELAKAHMGSFSPVLAFFPAGTHKA
ncbi:hypothetical protein AAL_04424 [Moelleriella libera RCEF 2490]|uniref:MARVEL-like domain protein n=1 Tax=Moelleriella libera RCEF 2490 TaxID=1081109 RepID=A0A168C4C4_9HYPO|nr:hypothetical protein AAL_04424 [Moelleriella libera RCEF 2490]